MFLHLQECLVKGRKKVAMNASISLVECIYQWKHTEKALADVEANVEEEVICGSN